MKKKQFIFQLITVRFQSLRKELRYLFILTFTSVILSQLIFENIEAMNSFQYNFGVIYIKLCYSYISAFIFYYLVVYAPKERKRAKAFRFINNKIHRVNNMINGVLTVIIHETDDTIKSFEKLKLSEFNDYCSKIDASKKVYFHNTATVLHNNYYEFLEYKMSILKTEVQQLMVLNELISDDMFLNLNNMNDILSQMFDDYKLFVGKDLTRYSHSLFDLNFERMELWENFQNNYRTKYDFEYHHNERKRNKKRLH